MVLNIDMVRNLDRMSTAFFKMGRRGGAGLGRGCGLGPVGNAERVQPLAQVHAGCVHQGLQFLRVAAGGQEEDVEFRHLAQGAGERLDVDAGVTGHHPGEGRGHDRLVVAAHGEQARGAGAAAEGAVEEGGERPADDGLQFGRHTGQADDGGTTCAQEHPGRGAHRVDERFGPGRQAGHLLAEGIEPGLGDDAAGVEVVVAGPHHGAPVR